jgi:hypothetical protein
MTTNHNDSLVKTSQKFTCAICNYTTSRKYNLDLHLNSIKHKNSLLTTNDNDSLVKISKIYQCQNCDKEFNDRAGLWRHNKKCCVIKTNDEPEVKNNNNNATDKDDLINYLIKENQEFKNLILEIVKKDTYNISNNTTNSHNKTFNLQFFLNETCKDAMNIMDFVDSIKLQLCDLEKVGKIGYVEGISNIIVKNLNSLDEPKRPVHCTDAKREVMYVKDEDKWEKENESKQKIRKAIKHVAHKNSKMLKEFKTKHPDCDKSESKFSDQYNKLVIEALGGKGDNDLEKEDKIIKNIAKEVVIDKHGELI